MTQTCTAGDETPQNSQIRADSPASLLAAIPQLLGFVPEASLVVIGIEPPGNVKVTLRYDLPDPPGAGVAADVAAHAVGVIGAQDITTMMTVGYGPETLVALVAAALRDAAARDAGTGAP